jgi:hypothetical protein
MNDTVIAIVIWAVAITLVVVLAELWGRRYFLSHRSRKIRTAVNDGYESFAKTEIRLLQNARRRYSLSTGHQETEEALRRSKEYRREYLFDATIRSSQGIRFTEFRTVVWLVLLSSVLYLIAYLALRPILTNVQHGSFAPTETAQIITAAGGVGLAIGTSIAAVVKSFALLLHARADIIRARAGLPPADAADVETE